MKYKARKTGGFTLVEVLIASTIFTILSIMATTVFVSVVRIQNRIILENQIYEDARFMMERIAREVRNNTIDYEEYYRENCLNDPASCVTPYTTFGSQTGCYAQQFYNPGTPPTLGAVVNNGIVDKTSLDINSGQNPYTNPVATRGPETASAVCDQWTRPNAPGGNDCSDPSHHEQEHLFLISADGGTKTFIGRQKVNNNPVEYATAMIKMFGTDSTGDGVRNQWYNPLPISQAGNYNQCLTGFDCRYTPYPTIRPIYNPSSLVQTLEASMEDISSGTNYQNFIWKGLVPITPLRTHISSLKFFVAPLEDPRKAFAESDPSHAILQQPHVTIVMTVQPAESELGKFIGEDPPTVTLQSTVSSRTYREVKSYTGTDVCP